MGLKNYFGLLVIGCSLWLISILLIGCNPRPTESPWEPVPTDVATTWTATAGQTTPTAIPLGSVSARLNEPFNLKIGQIATILDTPEQFGVKFHSVKQDSRCPKQVNCAETGQVSLVLQPLRDSIELPPLATVTINPGLPDDARVDFGGYQVQLTNVEPYPEHDGADKEIASDTYVATLVVSKPVTMTTPAITPPSVTTPPPIQKTQLPTCPALTRGDAAEILGEAVKETPAEMFFFQPADDPIAMHGLCGYGSVAFTPNQPAPENTPAIFPETFQSDHAVTAGRLTDSKRQEQLVSLASALNAADASGNAAALYPKLLTFYAAGAWFDDMLSDFVTAEPDLTGVRINRMDGLGDSAIWVGREFAGGRYAALVAQKGETLFVVAALTSDQRSEDGARIAMTTVLKKMLQ